MIQLVPNVCPWPPEPEVGDAAWRREEADKARAVAMWQARIERAEATRYRRQVARWATQVAAEAERKARQDREAEAGAARVARIVRALRHRHLVEAEDPWSRGDGAWAAPGQLAQDVIQVIRAHDKPPSEWYAMPNLLGETSCHVPWWDRDDWLMRRGYGERVHGEL